MSGPPKTPTALVLLKGNPGHRPINDAEPMPPEGELQMPMHWRQASDAAREWKRMLPILTKMRVLTVADQTAFAAYCEQHQLYNESMSDVLLLGRLIENAQGNMVRNPALQTARDSLAMVKSLCAEFGMTPSGRARMTVPGTASDQDGVAAAILS